MKTIKRDYISIMPKPDGLTAAKNLAEAFEHYNEWHPHSALGYRSPREYLRQREGQIHLFVQDFNFHNCLKNNIGSLVRRADYPLDPILR